MRYPPHLLDEIRARLPVSTVVGRKVRLRKAGREWSGLSPFNKEKTPSFYANDQKQRYFDFSAGKDGDIFNFLMETEGLTFPEAVENLAAEAGVELPKFSEESEREFEVRRGLQDIVELACRYYEGEIAKNGGRAAREYLMGRGIDLETQAEFRIGYAPNQRDGLLGHLRSKGVDDSLAIQAGLVSASENGRDVYDRFRGRVIFPIQDRQGKVVAFGGRAMADDVKPKYLNSPETTLFKKGELVFNGHRAKNAARSFQLAVVEGYVDAISVWRAGHKAVVATLGTAFTEEQIRTLWQIDPEPTLCFDGDRAGRAAAFRAIDRMAPALQVGRTFRFAFLPDGQDPDDLIRHGGIDAFQSQLRDAKRFWDVLWQRETSSIDTSNPDGIALLDMNLRQLTSKIQDAGLRYRYEVAAKISINELAYRETRRRFSGRAGDVSANSLLRQNAIVTGSQTNMLGVEKLFLGISVAYPEIAAAFLEEMHKINFRGTHRSANGGEQSYNAFASDLINILNTVDEPSTEIVHNRINPVFYDILDDVHGRCAGGREYGYALAQRFPAFRYVRDRTFFARTFQMLLMKLSIREMEDHLAEEIRESVDVYAVERCMRLRAQISETIEVANSEDRELGEVADTYRPRRVAA